MRVLYVHGDRRPPGSGGGAESLLRDQAEGLKRLGHSSAWWYGDGELAAAIDGFRPDIVHVSTIHCYPTGLAPAVWLQEQRIPHVWALMDYWPFCAGRMLLSTYDVGCSAIEGTCDSRCDQGRSPAEWAEIVNRSPVVALNPHTADIYRRNGLRCDFTVELGIDIDLFRPPPNGEGRAGIVTSCAWPEQPTKGMHVVERAVRGTALDVGLISHQPREQVAEALRRASVYVFPSTYQETFGLSLCEAMASGCAVIASDVAGARAQVHQGTGALVPPRDSRALAEALQRLAADPALCREMGEAARAHVERDHSLEAMARRWLAVYQEVLS